MDLQGRLYPRWMRDIFEDPVWRQRPAFRSTSVPECPPDEGMITTVTSREPTPELIPDSPIAEKLKDLKY